MLLTAALLVGGCATAVTEREYGERFCGYPIIEDPATYEAEMVEWTEQRRQVKPPESLRAYHEATQELLDIIAAALVQDDSTDALSMNRAIADYPGSEAAGNRYQEEYDALRESPTWDIILEVCPDGNGRAFW